MMERSVQSPCDFGEDRAAAYAAGRLVEPEVEAFEQHLFACPSCVDQVEQAIEIRSGLTEPADSHVAPETRRLVARLWWPWFSALAAAAVLLAVGTGVWLRAPQPQAPIRSEPAAGSVQPAGPPRPSLSEMARVQPPVYLSKTLRGFEDEARSQFREAMQDYQRGEYRAAIPRLEAAARLDPEAPDIRFFLGICYLLTDQDDSAIDHLAKTVALGETPYLEEAHFYLAKAYLSKADLGKARLELERIIELQGDREHEAQELMSQIERLRP